MIEPMRVLILSAPVGAGHDAASRAVREQLEDQGATVDIDDGLALLGLSRVVVDGYHFQILHAAWSWRWMYRASRSPRLIRLLGRWLSWHRGRPLLARIEAGDYDHVISAYPLVSAALAGLRRRGKLPIHCSTLITDFDPHPGQHLRLRVLDRQRWWQSHPFSFSAVPRRGRWRITVAGDGDYTRSIGEVAPGTRVAVSGVYGHLRPSSRTRNGVALIAGGSGITPLRALLEAFPKRVDARVLYRARSADDVIMGAELDKFAASHGSSVDYLLGPRDPDPSLDVLSPGSLAGIVPDLNQRDVYVCGHAGFVDTVCQSLHELGVPGANVHSERFDP